ncbi:MAG: alpha/beta hydrolase [Spirochaetota bacterium]
MQNEVLVEQGSLRNRRGLTLRYRTWRSRALAPTGTAVLVHGLGEHAGGYHRLACLLAGFSYQVYCLDLYGFGASEGKRGHVVRIADYLADLRLLERIARAAESPCGEQGAGSREAPGLFRGRLLFGHSMGGLLALAYLERYPGEHTHAVISSPALDPAFGVPAHLRLLGKLLDVLWPSCPFDNRIGSEQLTSDQSARERYQEDPLRHELITPRLFNELVRLGKRVWKDRSGMSPGLRLLVLVGGEDTVIRREDPRDFLRDLPVRSSRLEVLEGARHDLLAGEAEARTFGELASWLAGEAAG